MPKPNNKPTVAAPAAPVTKHIATLGGQRQTTRVADISPRGHQRVDIKGTWGSTSRGRLELTARTERGGSTLFSSILSRDISFPLPKGTQQIALRTLGAPDDMRVLVTVTPIEEVSA